jgi:uncharacterized lipoprotein YddW (UPF0748 family)
MLTFSISAQSIRLKREVRGVCIATVGNIDWPSSNKLTSGEQITELEKIFDKLQKAGINIVFFQIRTECDALYESSYEPWSYWLTRKQGTAPDPFFDPLAFAVEAAHSRGMKLHAWFNPYRAVRSVGDYEICSTHITKTHPDWILAFGKYKMLNPGLPQVTDYIVKIIRDIVKRYDVDGVNFDDYFYPYSPQITDEDSAAFKKYKGSFNNIDNWRRHNVNNMIDKVYHAINEINPRVEFGVFPFGIVENKYSGTHGFNAYDKIYCDPLTWLEDKTVDYIAPQCYWEIGNKNADYAKLVKWWSTVTNGRQLYIGQFSSEMMASSWKGSFSEIGDEIRLNRRTPNVSGSVFFSAKSIFDNYSGLADTLKKIYQYPALLPVMSWKDSSIVPTPIILIVDGDKYYRDLKWDMLPAFDQFEEKYNYVVYRFNNDDLIDLSNPAKIIYITKDGEKNYTDNQILTNDASFIYVVTAIDCMQKESENYTKYRIDIH